MKRADRPRLRALVRLPLLAYVVILAAVVIAAVVAVGEVNDAWAAGLAVAAAIAGTVAVTLVVRAELAETDPPAATTTRTARRTAAALGGVALAAVAIAVYSTTTDAADSSTSPATATTAVRTVRDFLVAAAVDHDGEAACGFLTVSEQARVGAAADGECRQILDDGSLPTPDDATTEAAVRALPAAVTIRHGRATVRLGSGRGARTFLLVPATFAEQSEFNAPASAWRIAGGAVTGRPGA